MEGVIKVVVCVRARERKEDGEGIALVLSLNCSSNGLPRPMTSVI